jgi:glycosyltransferase involved in cell wall biosynthesis
MKVLLVSTRFGRSIGGSYQHVYMLWKYLRDQVNFEIWTAEKVGYVNIPKLKTLSLYLKFKLKQKIPNDVDIIHIHSPRLIGLFTRSTKKKILTIHGEYKRELIIRYGILAKPIVAYIDRNARKADAITTVSPLWAQLHSWKWIPNMVEMSEIRKIPPAHEDPANPFHDIVDPDRFILFVGRDDPVKDYPLFRRIAKKAYEEFGLKAVSLGTVRGDTEYIIHAKAPWRVVIGLMKSALALVITSRHEGFPTVLLEAWASGCPVVARRIPALEVFEKMHPGSLLLFSNDPDPVNSAVNVLAALQGDEALRAQLSSKGYEAARSYDAPIVSRKYYNLYKEVLSID